MELIQGDGKVILGPVISGVAGFRFFANPHLRDKSRVLRLHASLMILTITIEKGETNPLERKKKTKGRRRFYKKVNTKTVATLS